MGLIRPLALADGAASGRRQAASNARIADHFESAYEEWRALAKKLQRENVELRETVAAWKLAHDVQKASDEASDVAAAEWRRLHPDSPMNAAVGTRKDGSPLRRSTSIWIEAFDLIARRLGIANPAAHRIS